MYQLLVVLWMREDVLVAQKLFHFLQYGNGEVLVIFVDLDDLFEDLKLEVSERVLLYV